MRESELGDRDWAWLESCIGEEEEDTAVGYRQRLCCRDNVE